MPDGSRQPRVAIVVLNYNGLADTLLCLESLRGIRGQADVILVDNASTVDPSAESLRVYPDLDIIRTSENLGYAGGNNRGIERALARGADYVLVLNNDTVVEPDIVTVLVAAFEATPSLGILGPVVNYMDEPEAVMTDGVAFNPGPGTEFFKRIVVPVGDSTRPVVPVDIVNGCCLMASASVLRAIGPFDEHFFIVHEESDFCLRAKRAGFSCAVVGRTLVRHKGSSAFKRSGRQLQRYFDARNLFHLLRRHSGRVSSSRSFVPSLVHYLKYVSYRYAVERETGTAAAARAVTEGTADAFCGRWGPYRPKAGVGLFRALAHAVFAAAYRIRHGSRPSSVPADGDRT